MFQLKTFAMAAALSLAASSAALSADTKIGSLMLHDLRARATLPGAPVAGGYLTIMNMGSESDRLIGGSSAFSGKVEVHEMKIENDVMKMRAVEGGLEIPAGGSVELKPGGLHLMFMKLSEQLKPGESRKATLVFEKAGPVDVEFDVVDRSGKKPKMDHSGHGDHKSD